MSGAVHLGIMFSIEKKREGREGRQHGRQDVDLWLYVLRVFELCASKTANKLKLAFWSLVDVKRNS